MKKQLLSLISCTVMATVVHAQTNIFFENFESPVMEAYPNWTATERDGDTSGMHNTWHSSQPYSASGFSGQFVATSFAGLPTTSIDHLFRSPVITLPSGNTFLSFKVAAETPAGERYAVYVLPAGGSFQGTETPLFAETITSQAAITRSVNIPANYAGQQIRLYFRHFEQGNVFLYLDDVRVATGTVALSVSETGTTDKDHIEVYPNPVKEQLYIKSPSGIISTEVFDMAGRTLKVRSNEDTINVSSLEPGNYIIRIETKNSTKTRKITKH